MKYKTTLFLLPIITSCLLIIIVRRINSNLFLYETIVSSIVCSLFFTVFIMWHRKPVGFDKYKFLLTLLLSGSLSYNLYFSTLMNVDRSKSFYIIQWVAELQPTKINELQDELVKKYGYFDSESILKRITEQQKRGIISGEKILYLTKYGTIYYEIANLTAQVFTLEGWNDAKILKNNEQKN